MKIETNKNFPLDINLMLNKTDSNIKTELRQLKRVQFSETSALK